MTTGAKVAVGVAAGAAVAGAAALVGTQRGRSLAQKASKAALDVIESAGEKLRHSELASIAKPKLARTSDRKSTSSKTGKTAKAKPASGSLSKGARAADARQPKGKPLVLAASSRSPVAGFSLGGGSLGSSSLGGNSSSGIGFGPKTGAGNAAFEKPSGQQQISARIANADATRQAVRGRSGHR